jgi:hypothetical protein
MHNLVPAELKPDADLSEWVVVSEDGNTEDGF